MNMSNNSKSLPVPGKLYRHKDKEQYDRFCYIRGDEDGLLLYTKPGDVVLVLGTTTTNEKFPEEKTRFLDGSGMLMRGRYGSGAWNFWWEEVEP